MPSVDRANVIAPQGNALDLRLIRRAANPIEGKRAGVYWADFLLSWLCFVASFLGILSLDGILCIISFIAATLAGYRASAFIHEIAHLQEGDLPGFETAWNVLWGFPMLLPSYTYEPHLSHHKASSFGTSEDPEYLPFVQKGWLPHLDFLLHPFYVPIALLVRYSLVPVVALFSKRFRTLVDTWASSIVMHPSFKRIPPKNGNQLRKWRLQEFWCLAYICAGVMLVSLGLAELYWFAIIYVLAIAMMCINLARTLVSHRYHGEGQEISFGEQVLDSVDHPSNPLSGELWAPVGLRFHALHHLFPRAPYHALPTLYRRIASSLPPDNPFYATSSKGFFDSLKSLLSDISRERKAARSRAAQKAE